MKDILLIMPGINTGRKEAEYGADPERSMYFPLGLTAVGSYLEHQGYRVKIFDARLYSAAEALEILLQILSDTWLVGISVLSMAVPEALEISNLIKKYDRNIHVTWGGIHPTLFPQQTVGDSSVDYVVVGEGEIPFLKLIRYLDKSEGNLERISNIAYREDKEIRLRRKFEYVDMDRLPLPAYHLLEMEKYVLRKLWNGKWVRCLQIEGSRGCPFECAFCVEPIVSRRRWRPENPEKLISEIEYLKGKYKINHLMFMDENFFANKRRSSELIKNLTKLRISWEATCRFDCFREDFLDNEFMKELAKSGCQMLRMGMESGSARVRDFIKKRVTENEILRGVELCAKYNIQPMVSYMLGIPTETKEEIKRTLRLIAKLQTICPNLIHSGPQIFRPYPGSELYELCRRSGFREPNTLKGWAILDMSFSGYASSGFPWVKDFKYVLKINWTFSRVKTKNKEVQIIRENLFRKICRFPLILLATFRYRLGFWDFLFEGYLFQIWLRLKRRTYIPK